MPDPSLSQIPFLEPAERWLKQAVAGVLRLLVRSRSPDHLDFQKIKNILVVRQHDQLGDMLCVVPLLRALRSRFPEASIVLIASPVNFEIMQHHPFVNDVVNYDKGKLSRSPSEFVSFWKFLRKQQFDLAIVPSTVSISLTSNLLAYISGAALRVGAASFDGIKNPLSFLFQVAVHLDWTDDPHRHQTLRNLDVVRPLGIITDDLSLVIGLTEREREDAARFLSAFRAGHKMLVGFHPGAGKTQNCWPAERFAETANRLFDSSSVGAVITSGPKDDEAVNRMLRRLRCPYLIVRSKPIRTVAAIAGQLDLFVSNDTGVMHVVAASGVPTLSLFAQTDPKQWAPLGPGNRYVSSEDGNIETITVEEVFHMAGQMLSL